jgi:hypothetical protein
MVAWLQAQDEARWVRPDDEFPWGETHSPGEQQPAPGGELPAESSITHK